MYNIHLLPASFGDSILIEYGRPDEPHYILIDGGPYFAFPEVMVHLKKVAPRLQRLELLVVTHIDIDHIDGIIVLLNQEQIPFDIGQIWFNGWDQIKEAQSDLMGGKQGEYLSALIKEKAIPHNLSFNGKAVMLEKGEAPKTLTLAGGMEITLLGPTSKALAKLADDWEEVVAEVGNASVALARLREDTRYDEDLSDLLGSIDEATVLDLQEASIRGDKSAANGSSIAFIAQYDHRSCLFAGDAPSGNLYDAINALIDTDNGEKLQLHAWKLAHHGSRKSTLDEVMQIIDCKKILISSDGKRYKHPDVETVAKLLKNNGPDLELYFNFKSSYNDMWDDDDLKASFSYTTCYTEEEHGGISLGL